MTITGTLDGKVETATDLSAIDFPAQTQDIYDTTGKHIRGYKRIVRTDTNATLSVVSDHYKLVEHKEAMFPAVELLGKEGWKVYQSHVERSGAKAYIELRRITATVKVLNEPVGQRILVKNSYDKTSGLTLVFGAIVLKCLNGLVVPGRGSFGFDSHHIGDVNKRLDQLLKSYKGIGAALGSRMLDTYSQLDKLVPESIGREIIKRSIGERHSDAVRQYWQTGIGRDGEMNAWNLYNGVTQFLTHDFKGGWDRRERLNSQSLALITSWVKTGVLPKLEADPNEK